MAHVPKPKIAVDHRGQANVHGTIHDLDVFVVHTSQGKNRPGISDIVGMFNYLKATDDELGVQFAIDDEANVGQAGRLRDLMYHAKGANSISNGCELIGFAATTRQEWLGAKRKQLRKLSELIAWWSYRTGNPIRRSTQTGIAAHADFTESDHTDPGPGFPWWRLLRDARHYKRTGRHLAYSLGGLGVKGT